MENWFVTYERNYLETEINRSRLNRQEYSFIKHEELSKIIVDRMKEKNLNELGAIKDLISDVRRKGIKL